MVIIIIKTFYKSASAQQRDKIPESRLHNGYRTNPEDILIEFTNKVNTRVTQKGSLE
jgi:hypothetical protein